jgi:hypothetical protein
VHGRGRRSQWLPGELSAALRAVVCADLVRPSLDWVVRVPAIKPYLAGEIAMTRDPSGFARLQARCNGHSGLSPAATSRTLQRSALIVAAKGGVLDDIVVGDVLELLDAETTALAAWPRDVPVFYQLLRELGTFGDQAPARLRELRAGGQRTPEELIDRHQLACRAVRDLLVDYLRERQPGLDYNSLRDLAYFLGNRFWKDLELHHPGIDSLRLPAEVVAAWRERLLTKPKPVATGTGEVSVVAVPRISYRDCLVKVRAFYLDLAQWALEDPGRWARWVAPCPVGQDEVGHRKLKRRRKARMDARTRERLPVLPVLARTVDQRRKAAAARLRAARDTQSGEAFTVDGHTLTRSVLAPSTTTDKVWADDPASGGRRDLGHEEDYAFWAWAAVEVLRQTGIRIEELLALSHHSLVQYRLPTTGEVVPLLQIAPSKADAERLLVVSPELADVLATILRRIRESTGAVPLVPAYDWHECVWMPPAPLLFQRRFRTERRAISHGTIRKMLQAALAHTGLVDPVDGGPLNYTPRLPPALHHRRRPQRPSSAHRPGHRRPPRRQRHPGLQGGLSRRGDPGPPGVPGPPAGLAAQRGIPGAHRPGVAAIPWPLRAAQGLAWDLRPRLRNPLHPRTRVCQMPAALARPGPTRPAGGDPRQPHRPHRRSRTRRLARRGRRPPSQPRRRQRQARPTRPPRPQPHHRRPRRPRPRRAPLTGRSPRVRRQP